jgi:hypothetical protein
VCFISLCALFHARRKPLPKVDPQLSTGWLMFLNMFVLKKEAN